MRKKLFFSVLAGLVLFVGKPIGSYAQFTLNGQLRTRTEFRDGLGTLNAKGAEAAFFTKIYEYGDRMLPPSAMRKAIA